MASQRRQIITIRPSIPEVRSLGSNQQPLSFRWVSGRAVDSGGQKYWVQIPGSLLFIFYFPTLKAQGRRSSPACRCFLLLLLFEHYLPPSRDLCFVPPFFFLLFTHSSHNVTIVVIMSPVFFSYGTFFCMYRPADPSTYLVRFTDMIRVAYVQQYI